MLYTFLFLKKLTLKLVMVIPSLRQIKADPFLAFGDCLFLTVLFFIKDSTIVRILPCLFVKIMVVAPSFFYMLMTTFQLE